MEIYGAAVADKLDNNKGSLKRRYYRQVSVRNSHDITACKNFLSLIRLFCTVGLVVSFLPCLGPIGYFDWQMSH